MNRFVEAIVTIAMILAGVAIVAALVSPNARTSQVIQAAASGYGNNLGVALSPVTGERYAINLSYPNSGGYGMPNFGSMQSMPGLY